MIMNKNLANKTLEEADCLYSDMEVQASIEKMAVEITKILQHDSPVVLCVMNGAVIPVGHLLTRLSFPLEVDYVHATRYKNKTRGAELEWIAKPSTSLKNRTVLVVDDIFDEGVTLQEISKYCAAEGATKVYSAVLVNKLHDRKVDFNVDFIAVETEDRYLFGYGMDYQGYLRNVNGIYAVKGL